MKIIKGNSGKSPITRGLLLQVGADGVLVLDEVNVPHMFNGFQYCKTTDIFDSINIFENKLPPSFLDSIHHVVFLTTMVNFDKDVINKLLRLEVETGKQFYMQMNDGRMDHIKVYDMK
jgi:hypothetical protein